MRQVWSLISQRDGKRSVRNTKIPRSRLSLLARSPVKAKEDGDGGEEGEGNEDPPLARQLFAKVEIRPRRYYSSRGYNREKQTAARNIQHNIFKQNIYE